jgi:hypothetical protein
VSRWRRLRILTGWALAGCCIAASVASAAPEDRPNLAIFDFELFDTSIEGEVRGADPAEAERLVMITELIRDAYRARDEVELVDVSPLRERLDSMPKLRTCKGCETKLAAPLGADQTMSGFVHKVSTLILSVTLFVRDVDSGDILYSTSASIRGNTDESWAHGVNYLIRNKLFEESAAAAPQ